MSVIMTMTMSGDSAKLESAAGENQDRLGAIVEKAKGHGLIAHRFYGSDDGTIMVIDEWPDAQSFQAFFEESQGEIGPLMEEAGAGQPTITFWNKLNTGDDDGWDA
jgi:hypothetical protein